MSDLYKATYDRVYRKYYKQFSDRGLSDLECSEMSHEIASDVAIYHDSYKQALDDASVLARRYGMVQGEILSDKIQMLEQSECLQ